MARNKTLFRLNEQIYDNKCVERAIKEFKEVCEIERTADGYSLTPVGDYDGGLLKGEFCNYVLGLMKN